MSSLPIGFVVVGDFGAVFCTTGVDKVPNDVFEMAPPEAKTGKIALLVSSLRHARLGMEFKNNVIRLCCIEAARIFLDKDGKPVISSLVIGSAKGYAQKLQNSEFLDKELHDILVCEKDIEEEGIFGLRSTVNLFNNENK